MHYYFLLPSFQMVGADLARGGIISNYHLIKSFSSITDVTVVASFSDAPDNQLGFSLLKGASRYSRGRYIVERLWAFRNRASRLIAKRQSPRSAIITTRGSIPSAYGISKSAKLPFGIVVRAFEDFELTGRALHLPSSSMFRRLDGHFSASTVELAYQSCDFIITNSHFMKKRIAQDFSPRGRIFVLYPPLDIARRIPEFDGISTVGFINGAEKGDSIVVEIAKLLPHVKFYVYGSEILSGPSNLYNKGYERDRNKLFSSVDLVLVPSQWDEPFGRVAAEAIWQGKPVLVAKRGGLLEAVQDEFWAVDSDDPSIWSKRISSLCTEPNFTQKKIKSSQSLLEKISSPEAHFNVVKEIDAFVEMWWSKTRNS